MTDSLGRCLPDTLENRPQVSKVPPRISRGGGRPTLPDFWPSSWDTRSRQFSWSTHGMLAMLDSSQFQGGDLTPAERLWLDAMLAGRTLDLNGEAIRAGMLRSLVSGEKADASLPPVGVVLNNATIQGCLDLEGCHVTRPLVFQRCKFTPIESARAAISLRDATLKRVAFYECHIAGALKADRAVIESAMFITGTTL